LSNKIQNNLSIIFKDWSHEKVEQIFSLPSSGSYRQYFRIKGRDKTAIGVFNNDIKENEAFFSFTKHFLKNDLNVPEIYSVNPDNKIYLIKDLGDITLFSIVLQQQKKSGFSEDIIEHYKKAIDELPKFQITAGKGIDYSRCYPGPAFNKQSMLWDLNYFKYYFLKLAKIPFDEHKLENDFQHFTDFLLKAGKNYFMYRDFQSRNIMIFEGKPYFIDYQGGRKGALQYDIASLLFQVKAAIPNDIKNYLMEYYLSKLGKYFSVNSNEFKKYYWGFVYLRLLQVLGAYGFRGLYEKKSHFLQSIPMAIENLKWLLQNIGLSINLPTLMNVLNILTENQNLQESARPGRVSKVTKTISKQPHSKLKITINSFSYKKGIPDDKTENGGGFVFDSRALPNPGRLEELKYLNGKDKQVIEFLEKEKEVEEFFNYVFSIIDHSVEKYLERDFSDLMVNFGCTGGQHRSVFCAEKLTKHLKIKYNVKIILIHIEEDNWKK